MMLARAFSVAIHCTMKRIENMELGDEADGDPDELGGRRDAHQWT